jgi:hypothetical protein
MWLPPAPEPPAHPRRLWRPPVDELKVDGELRYIVVDELHEGIAGLVVSLWPRVDARGRLVFADSEATSARVAARADLLEALLRSAREPVLAGGVDESLRAALRDREVEIGDVYAARLRSLPVSGDPAAWLVAPVFDITGPARELAKTQTSAALSGAMSSAYLTVVAEEYFDAGH